MAVTRVSTKDADFIIEQGKHPGMGIFGPRGPDIRTKDYLEADAYVLEGHVTGAPRQRYPADPADAKMLHASATYQDLIERYYSKIAEEARRNGKSIWSPDVLPQDLNNRDVAELLENVPTLAGVLAGTALALKTTDKGMKITRREALKKTGIVAGGAAVGLLAGPPGLPSLVADLKKGEMPGWLREYGVTTGDIIKGAKTEGRSAVIAHKVDEFIVPRLRKRLGRRPTVYIWMGSAHQSLPKLITEPGYRGEVLKAFHPHEERFTSPVEGIDTVRDCVEYDWSKPVSEKEPTIIVHENAVSFPKPKKSKGGWSRRDVLRGRRK